MLNSKTFWLRTGPFVSCVTTDVAGLRRQVEELYPVDWISDAQPFADFHVGLHAPRPWRRWLRPQVRFFVDRTSPYLPLPRDQALPMLEWGLNGCICTTAHFYHVYHAAAVERGGQAAILPGVPGAGKSTLAAGLAFRGWRLLSDELTLIDGETGALVALARPISLKNASIAVMRRFAPEAVCSRATSDTAKGTVALLRAPEASLSRVAEPARPRWVVFPRWSAGASARLEPMPKGLAFMQMIRQGFNYGMHGPDGFTVLAELIERSDCFRLSYGDLDDAISIFDRLAAAG